MEVIRIIETLTTQVGGTTQISHRVEISKIITKGRTNSGRKEVDSIIISKAKEASRRNMNVEDMLKQIMADQAKLSTITVIDEEVTAKCVIAKDLLMGQDIKGDAEAWELANVLEIPNVSMLKKQVEPLNEC